MKQLKKKPGRKPLAKKRAVKRRANTEAVITEMVASLGPNPFGVTGDFKNIKAVTKPLVRAIRKFQYDYMSVIDKYGSSFSNESIARKAVIDTIYSELDKQLRVK